MIKFVAKIDGSIGNSNLANQQRRKASRWKRYQQNWRVLNECSAGGCDFGLVMNSAAENVQSPVPISAQRFAAQSLK